ncbi:hypothetical protein OAY86_01165 [Candidatus Pelagibacter sp.]|nr:hypothetical protein [Candidatus Pelagibacter sp.]
MINIKTMNLNILNTYKNFHIRIFLIFSFIGIILRVWISQFGSNFDFAMWQINLDIFKEGKSIWHEGMYAYGSPWIYTLYILDSISLPFLENNSFIQNIPGSFYRFKIVIFLSFIDISIFYLLYKNYSLKIGLLYLINPISIILTGHHNAFNNYAILFGFLAVLNYGDLNSKDLSFKKIFSLFLFGLSISIKHILIFFPIWWAFKEKKIINKILIISISYMTFIVLFIPFYEDFQKIIYNILYLGRHETGPFWKMFLPELLHRYFNFFTLASLLLIVLGIFLVNKKLKESFYLYLIATTAFAPQMYTQYLFIPLIAIAIYWNFKLIIFTTITFFLFLVDGDQLNIQFLREIFNWDLRSTRIVFYPLVLILMIEFFERSIGANKFFNQINLFKKLIIDKLKKSLSLK